MTAPAITREATRKQALERSELPELFEAAIDLTARQRTETVHTELLATVAAHHGPINHRAADLIVIYVAALQIDALPRHVSHESASKAIACASGIEHVLQKITGHHEMPVSAPQHGPVLAALDHERIRPHI